MTLQQKELWRKAKMLNKKEYFRSYTARHATEGFTVLSY